jgi:thiosulfate/3-mercaptopyruvate sulfurtransferase
MNYQHAQYLVNPSDLNLEDPALRLFDATVYLKPAEKGYRAESGAAKFAERHIPGANFLDQIGALSDTGSGLGFTLPPPAVLQAGLRDAGIHDDSRVVFYSGGHLMWATRVWWLAYYAGHKNIAVLNGGLQRWRAESRPVTADVEAYAPGDFTVSPVAERFVGAAEVIAAMSDDSVCTVNALSADVYGGEGDHHYGRRGHIPGSLHLFYDELLDEGSFKPVEDLKASLSARGLLEAPRVITYCGGGISATIDAFGCLLAGQENVAVYDGSMSEWVRDETLPLKTGMSP